MRLTCGGTLAVMDRKEWLRVRQALIEAGYVAGSRDDVVFNPSGKRCVAGADWTRQYLEPEALVDLPEYRDIHEEWVRLGSPINSMEASHASESEGDPV